jgi:2-iminobutanoate/2-iminopropanoate deaminase
MLKKVLPSGCLGMALVLSVAARAQVTAVSAAIEADGYVYVSGQGPTSPAGGLPEKFTGQVHQSLDNVRSALEKSGLGMDHVVYLQIYLEDISNSAELNRVFGSYFAEPRPALAVLGVARLPQRSIEISAVAVRDLAGRRAIHPAGFPSTNAASPAILTRDRLFVSAMAGADFQSRVPADPAAQVDLALDHLQAVLDAAGLDLRNMVFVNPYLTSEIPMGVMNERYARRFEFGNTPARATIEVSSLPEGAHIEYTGVAVRDLRQRKAVRPKNMPPSPTASPCVFAANTLYCSAKSGFIPGAHGGVYADTTAHQLRQTMRNLLDNLEEAGMDFSQVAATNVYLDDLADAQAFDGVYTQYFTAPLPARTVIQQVAPVERKSDQNGHFPDLEQVSLIAVRPATSASNAQTIASH